MVAARDSVVRRGFAGSFAGTARSLPGKVAAVEGTAPADEFIPVGLASLGIEADEVDLAVMTAFHQLLWPPVLELLAIDTEGVEPERCPDLSRPPQ
jgi:hypothetical protein